MIGWIVSLLLRCVACKTEMSSKSSSRNTDESIFENIPLLNGGALCGGRFNRMTDVCDPLDGAYKCGGGG